MAQAGLGARVRISGETHRGGRITKAGRRDLPHVEIHTANTVGRTQPHGHREIARLEKRLGCEQAKVAVVHKLAVAIWPTPTKEEADHFADAQEVACLLFTLARNVGPKNLPDRLSGHGYARRELDRLGIGAELDEIV